MALDIGNLAGRGTLAQYIYDNVWQAPPRRGSGRDMEGMTQTEADLWKPKTITATINGQKYTIVAKRDERELFDSTPLQILSVTVDGKTYGPEEYDALLNQKYEQAADGNVITRALTGQDEPDRVTPVATRNTRRETVSEVAARREPQYVTSDLPKTVWPPVSGPARTPAPTPGQTPGPTPAPAGQGKLDIQRDASGNFVNLRILDAQGNPAKFSNGTIISMENKYSDEFFDAFAQYQITKDDIANTFAQTGMSAISLQSLSYQYALQNPASMNMTVIEGLGDAIKKVIASQKFTFMADIPNQIIMVVDQNAGVVAGSPIPLAAFDVFDPNDQANPATQAAVKFFDQVGALDIRGIQIAKLLNDIKPNNPANLAERNAWQAGLKKAYEDAHTAAGTTPDADVLAALNGTAAPAPTPQARAQLIADEVKNNSYAQSNGVSAKFNPGPDILEITVDGKTLPFDITQVQSATGDTLKDLLNANPSSFVNLAKVITGQTDPALWTAQQKLDAGTAIAKLGHTAGMTPAELDAVLDKIVPAGQPNAHKDAVIAARAAGLAPAPATPASPHIPGDPEWLKNLEQFARNNPELAIAGAAAGAITAVGVARPLFRATRAVVGGTASAVGGAFSRRTPTSSPEAARAPAPTTTAPAAAASAASPSPASTPGDRAAEFEAETKTLSQEARATAAETKAAELERIAEQRPGRVRGALSQATTMATEEARVAAKAARAAATAIAGGATEAEARTAAQAAVDGAGNRSLLQRNLTDRSGTTATARRAAAENAVNEVISEASNAASRVDTDRAALAAANGILTPAATPGPTPAPPPSPTPAAAAAAGAPPVPGAPPPSPTPAAAAAAGAPPAPATPPAPTAAELRADRAAARAAIADLTAAEAIAKAGAARATAAVRAARAGAIASPALVGVAALGLVASLGREAKEAQISYAAELRETGRITSEGYNAYVIMSNKVEAVLVGGSTAGLADPSLIGFELAAEFEADRLFVQWAEEHGRSLADHEYQALSKSLLGSDHAPATALFLDFRDDLPKNPAAVSETLRPIIKAANELQDFERESAARTTELVTSGSGFYDPEKLAERDTKLADIEARRQALETAYLETVAETLRDPEVAKELFEIVPQEKVKAFFASMGEESQDAVAYTGGFPQIAFEHLAGKLEGLSALPDNAPQAVRDLKGMLDQIAEAENALVAAQEQIVQYGKADPRAAAEESLASAYARYEVYHQALVESGGINEVYAYLQQEPPAPEPQIRPSPETIGPAFMSANEPDTQQAAADDAVKPEEKAAIFIPRSTI